MSLTVLVKSASNLPNVERFGKSDPMCVISLQGKFYDPGDRRTVHLQIHTLTRFVHLQGRRKRRRSSTITWILNGMK